MAERIGHPAPPRGASSSPGRHLRNKAMSLEIREARTSMSQLGFSEGDIADEVDRIRDRHGVIKIARGTQVRLLVGFMGVPRGTLGTIIAIRPEIDDHILIDFHGERRSLSISLVEEA